MRKRGKVQVKVPLLPWGLHRSSRNGWELDWKKRDGRAFLATTLSRTKAQSHSRASLLCSGTRSRSMVSRAGMWRSLGQFIEKVNRDKMLQGLWHKQRRLCLSWNGTGITAGSWAPSQSYPHSEKWWVGHLLFNNTKKILLFSLSIRRSIFESLFFFFARIKAPVFLIIPNNYPHLNEKI